MELISREITMVIFDCDGVLVDTERLSNAFMAKVITERGFPISGAESQKRFVGLSLVSVRDKLLSEEGIDLGEDFVDAVYSNLPSIFAQGVDAIPNVEKLLDILQRANLPWCVASSGKYDKMRLTLGASGLLPYFEDVLFSAYDLKRGKPHPDLFLHAAKSMGHRPETCVVIEDSLFGVQAAVSAGIRVFAYCGDETADRKALAAAGGEIIDDLLEVAARLGLN